MSKGRYEVVGRLPPGQGGKTLLAVVGGGQAFKRVSVLRPVGAAALIPVANLNPHLPAPLGVDEVEGSSYAVYDFFPGATLHEIADVYRAQDQLPPLGLAARVVIDAARIINLAHEHVDPLGGPGAFVHGGIAASSLLLGFDGEVRLIDFGLRKVNRFASPEAVAGGPFTSKSDVFSLAAAFHSVLTGFDKEYAATLARAPSAREFPPPSSVHPDASHDLDALLMRALFPDPRSRLSSAAELADDLERIVGEQLPQPAACATRLRQLFEERLDGLRNMVPRLSSDAGPATTPPKPRASAGSKPQLPQLTGSRPAHQPQASAPRKSGPRSPIPTGTQPEANPVGRRPTPPEVHAAFGDPDGLEDERTILADDLRPKPPPPPSTGMATKVEPTRSERAPPRPSGPKKPAAPLPEVPWESGPMAAEPSTGETDLRTAAAQGGGDAVPIEEVPTGLSRRVSGAYAAVPVVGGSTEEERARAVGQELVDTGEIEGDEADDLRDQPTVVRVSGQHPKLRVEPKPEEIAAAFGDVDALPEGEPGTAIITAREGPKAKGGAPNGPPVLEPALDAEPPSQPGSGPLDAPITGVLEHNKPKPPPKPQPPAKPKKKGGGARKLIAFMLVLMVAGLGYAIVKKPELLEAKVPKLKGKIVPLSATINAKLDPLLVKYGLKKPEPLPPPPEEPGTPVAETDGGEVAEVPAPPPPVAADGPDAGAAPVLAALEEDSDGGEEEEEDDDGGIYASDGGKHADGGTVQKKKKKKKKKRREWWKTQ